MDTIYTHFLRLADAEQLTFKVNEPVRVTIDTLSAVLCCTPRNVKFILRKLEQQRFIKWHPGRGRGHHSELTLLRSLNEALEVQFTELLCRGKLKEAIELIGSVRIDDVLREKLMLTLHQQMGFRSHVETDSGQDILRMLRSRQLGDLDPASVYTSFETYLLGQVCSTLISYDANTDTFLPALAHAWECSSDHREWVFYLRKGVRFHDGRVMTSQDVQASLNRLFEMNCSSLWLYRDIERAERIGDYNIRFVLKRANRFFLHLFSCIRMTVLPADHDSNRTLVGTGPFQIMEMSKDVIKLSAFDGYYGIRPHLDQVHIWFLPESASNDGYYDLPVSDRLNLTESNPQQPQFIDYPSLGCQYMLFNFHIQGLHHHLAFRQAMRIVYDPLTLVNDLGKNRITPASSFLPWRSATENWKAASLHDARALLEQSGYDGESFMLSYKKNKDSDVAEWLQRRALQIGLKIELEPFDDYLDVVKASHAPIVLREEILEDDWQYGMIHFFKNQSNSLHDYLTPEYQAILDEVLDPFPQLAQAERTLLLEQAEGLLRENGWLLHGCHMNKKAQLHQSIYGMQTSEFGFLDISKLWIKNP
ncbi:SgrR family transcriptional regulator [Paenibacillus barcinonensis]|uniref:MarR-like DNA-binding transcriptional regulator SgrR of sgrS sRNA n=1 Tax=Paenibacillus barcinonensis TaxID=198119 RepID=A0A2V4VU28_PAEBA|nr:ABC transporter substrate-binding protein [Paenibacillus barcinonensis]PYE50300.1 MarR-like DNA-binding transcriptional regulator SgrR of sgrS sRNA [Paenibacillus barcinonensis]QKS54981.1 SgrR family transcriptional regulator [Paenibacillus barcinonensis]